MRTKAPIAAMGATRAMAKKAAIRLSTAASHSPSPGESEARTSVSHPSGSGSRQGSVVLRDDTDEGGPALGNPPVLGGDVSRGRCNPLLADLFRLGS